MRVQLIQRLSAAVLLAVGLTASAWGEVFVLQSGGRVAGEWLNRDQSPRETFVVRTPGGAQITFERDQVAQVLFRSEAEQQYERLRPQQPDTVEAHLELAKWCIAQELTSDYRRHMQRVIELEPENEQARLALGYRQVAGRWMTREEEMAAKGLIYYEGRYRTRQEIELWKRDKELHVAERQWHSKIKQWRSWLLKPNKAAEAQQNLRAIRDPAAVDALAKYLKEDKSRGLKIMYVDILGQIASPAAVNVLVSRSLYDRDKEVRLTCLDHIVKLDPPSALTLYVKQLGSKSNKTVNRAGRALHRLNKKAAIEPLIGALVTEHKFKVQVGNPGQTSATFSGGGGGMSFGSKPPQIIERKIPNKEVLAALISLADGANFNYDIKAWKYWYASRKKIENLNARRDYTN